MIKLCTLSQLKTFIFHNFDFGTLRVVGVCGVDVCCLLCVHVIAEFYIVLGAGIISERWASARRLVNPPLRPAGFDSESCHRRAYAHRSELSILNVHSARGLTRFSYFPPPWVV